MGRLSALFCLLFLISLAGFGQEGMVQIEPADADGEKEIRVIYDASLGDSQLEGAAKVYMHSGVITDGPAGTSWQYVVGNWGADDGIGEMTPVAGETDVWEITLSPSARDYYDVPGNENMFRLAMVFRSADGNQKGAGTPGSYSWGDVAANGDIYVNLALENFIQITSPEANELFLNANETIELAAEASSDVSQMELAIDEGSGFNVVASVTSGTTISYTYTAVNSVDLTMRVTATIDGEEVTAENIFNLNVIPGTTEAPLPDGVLKGINYTSATTAVLVLEAPDKDFVYVVGDFNNWEADNNYLMQKDPDTDWFWYELTGLTPGQKYVFQYLVDGTIRVGDPYADEVADADDDPFIPVTVYPDIAPYDRPFGPASVLQTDQEPFSWAASENNWTPPAGEDLIIYELLIRDFLESHSYDDLIDTLSYIKRLGVNAIELMPIMEFEGNSSWGYNPSYFFAVDKYYGTKNDFKRFVQAAHAEGIAVIMDMVLNHAFGENALVRMYFEDGAPSEESPWFNRTARHPFNVGFDFNHESTFTQNFVDSVNHYWLSEYHVDGYRFDLSKGFTQVNSGSDVGAWSAYDASRIAILKRMAAAIWDDHPDAYVILEHFGSGDEEAELAAEGMIPWRNKHGDAIASLVGSGGNMADAQATTHVSYMESHDEERILYEAYGSGNSAGAYNTSDSLILFERHKMAAAFFFMLKGPKMLWQFGELGYDYLLNGPNQVNRLDEKPLPWGPGSLEYYEDPLRQYIFDVYSGVLQVRTAYADEWKNANYTTVDLTGADRQLVIDAASVDVVLVGNFGLEPITVPVEFTTSGTWYELFSGEEVDLAAASQNIDLMPGEFHFYTSERLSDGYENAVEVFDVPVTVDPDPFTRNTEITIRFDAARANAAGTPGLIGAGSVFMYSGVVKESGASKDLENIVDDGRAEMQPVDGEDDVWEITLTPADYYGLGEDENIFRIGMYFRNEDGSLLGKGFRGQDIFLAVQPDGNAVEITPADFSQNDEITIVFDTRFGNGALRNAEKVYMHSGVVLADLSSPTGDDWENVVGDWGQDNGVGEMTEVSGEPGKWEITLTPRSYYSITGSEQAYWLAMVFRNADGSLQSNFEAGDYDSYFVASNGDIFYAVPDTETVVSIDNELAATISVYPNPGKGMIYFVNREGLISGIKLTDLHGRRIREQEAQGAGRISMDISNVNPGMYLVEITDGQGRVHVRKIMVGR